MRADIRDEEKRRNSLGRADEDKERKSAIYLHKSPSHLDCSQRRRRAAWITHRCSGDRREERESEMMEGRESFLWASGVSLSYLDIWLPGWESSVPSWKETQTRVTQTVEQTPKNADDSAGWIEKSTLGSNTFFQNHIFQRELCKNRKKTNICFLKHLIMYSEMTCTVSVAHTAILRTTRWTLFWPDPSHTAGDVLPAAQVSVIHM